MTPLHWAVQRGRIEVIETLLGFGADINLVSKFGITPVELASGENRPDIYEILQNAEVFREARFRLSGESDAATLAATQSITLDGGTDANNLLAASADGLAGLTSQEQADLILENTVTNATPNTAGMKVLNAHGINFIPEDVGGGHLQKSLPSQSLALTDAGKLALNLPQTTKLTTIKRPASGSIVSTGVSQAKIIKIASPQTHRANTTTMVLGGSSNGIKSSPKVITVSREEFESIRRGKDYIFVRHVL